MTNLLILAFQIYRKTVKHSNLNLETIEDI